MTILLIILACIYCIIAGINMGIGFIFPDKESTISHIFKSIFWIIFIFIKDKTKSKNLINF